MVKFLHGEWCKVRWWWWCKFVQISAVIARRNAASPPSCVGDAAASPRVSKTTGMRRRCALWRKREWLIQMNRRREGLARDGFVDVLVEVAVIRLYRFLSFFFLSLFHPLNGIFFNFPSILGGCFHFLSPSNTGLSGVFFFFFSAICTMKSSPWPRPSPRPRSRPRTVRRRPNWSRTTNRPRNNPLCSLSLVTYLVSTLLFSTGNFIIDKTHELFENVMCFMTNSTWPWPEVCPIDWLIYRSIDWSIDWLIDRSTDWLIDWTIDWLIYRSIDWLNDWLSGSVIVR